MGRIRDFFKRIMGKDKKMLAEASLQKNAEENEVNEITETNSLDKNNFLRDIMVNVNSKEDLAQNIDLNAKDRCMQILKEKGLNENIISNPSGIKKINEFIGDFLQKNEIDGKLFDKEVLAKCEAISYFKGLQIDDKGNVSFVDVGFRDGNNICAVPNKTYGEDATQTYRSQIKATNDGIEVATFDTIYHEYGDIKRWSSSTTYKYDKDGIEQSRDESYSKNGASDKRIITTRRSPASSHSEVYNGDKMIEGHNYPLARDLSSLTPMIGKEIGNEDGQIAPEEFDKTEESIVKYYDGIGSDKFKKMYNIENEKDDSDDLDI